jgi:feruloyl-CoA synthase
MGEANINLSVATPAFKPLGTVEPAVESERRPDGSIILRDPRPPVPPERTIVAYLRLWADETPDRPILAQRSARGGWHKVSYSDMRRDADAAAQWLLDQGIAPGQSILILSPASLDHATLLFAALTVGITVVPVSPPYALQRTGWSKLRKVLDAVRPAAVFSQTAAPYADAVEAADLSHLPWIVAEDAPPAGLIPFSELRTTVPGEAVEAAFARTGPDTVAKILFSSGSTGWPKGIINTQRMLCLNQAYWDTLWHPEHQCGPFETLNWMPWHHTMAGNGLFNRSLRQGGTYYIDEGRPLPGQFQSTLDSLREISPHSYSDVPAGFAMLATALEEDSGLRDRFFRNLVYLQYAGASLPMELWQRWQDLSVAATGLRTPFLTGYGCTETGPLITQLYWPVQGSGYIGLPVPGVEVKLIPVDDTRYELRARGGNVTPGYVGLEDLYAQSLDEEGFYRTGDAVTLVDEAELIKGLRFASRVSEDFKLLTGTFVAVGSLRAQAVGAMMPLITDMVITGQDKAFVGALAWPNIAACRKLIRTGSALLTDSQVAAHPEVHRAIAHELKQFNGTSTASSMQIRRMLLLDEPPSAEENEITDKGYVNQRRVTERRAALIDQLYSEPPPAHVIEGT